MKRKGLKRVLPVLLSVVMVSGTVNAEELAIAASPTESVSEAQTVAESEENEAEVQTVAEPTEGVSEVQVIAEPLESLTIADVSDFQYELTVEGATITGYTGDAVVLEIPPMIEDKPVTCIGEDAFASNYSLQQVVLPDTVESVKEGAFYNCTSLVGIDLPANVAEIGWNAFDSCTVLQYINVAEENPFFTSVDGVLYSKDVKKLIRFPYGKSSLQVPEGVEVIGDKAFFMCHSLTQLTLPESLKTIELAAFYGCDFLTTVDFPENLVEIGESAFKFCDSLTEVEIPESVESIGERVFDICNNMTDITILNPDCEIGDHEWTILEEVTIHGYDNSTAQEYATQYERSFVSLGAAPEKENAGGENGDDQDITSEKVEAPQIVIDENAAYMATADGENIFIGKTNEGETTYWKWDASGKIVAGTASDYQLYYDVDKQELHLNGVDLQKQDNSIMYLHVPTAIILEPGSINRISMKSGQSESSNDIGATAISASGNLTIAGEGKLYVESENGAAIYADGVWETTDQKDENGHPIMKMAQAADFSIGEKAEVYITSGGNRALHVSGKALIREQAVLDIDHSCAGQYFSTVFWAEKSLTIQDSANVNVRSSQVGKALEVKGTLDITGNAIVNLENKSDCEYANVVCAEDTVTISGPAQVSIQGEGVDMQIFSAGTACFDEENQEWQINPISIYISDEADVNMMCTGGIGIRMNAQLELKNEGALHLNCVDGASTYVNSIRIEDASLEVETDAGDNVDRLLPLLPGIVAESLEMSGETAKLIVKSKEDCALDILDRCVISDGQVTVENSWRKGEDDVYRFIPAFYVKDIEIGGNAVVTVNSEGNGAMQVAGDMLLEGKAVATITNKPHQDMPAIQMWQDDMWPDNDGINTITLKDDSILKVETQAMPETSSFEFDGKTQEFTSLHYVVENCNGRLYFYDNASLQVALVNLDPSKQVDSSAVCVGAVYNHLTTDAQTIDCKGVGEAPGLYYDSLQGDGFVGNRDNCTPGTLIEVPKPSVVVNGREVTFSIDKEGADISYSTSRDMYYSANTIQDFAENGETKDLGNLHGTIYARAVYQGMWSEPVSFTISIPEKDDVCKKFPDIKETDWFVNSVQYACDNGVMKGTGSAFEPNGLLQREQFVQVLYNISGNPSVAGLSNSFSDVENEWYYDAVLWATDQGVTDGIGGGKFGVGTSISREQLVTMAFRYASKCGYNMNAYEGEIDNYADGDQVSDWAKEAFDWAICQGIITGKGTGSNAAELKLDPQGTATRAECAAIMMRLLKANEK